MTSFPERIYMGSPRMLPGGRLTGVFLGRFSGLLLNPGRLPARQPS